MNDGNAVQNWIDQTVNSNDIVLFMKGTSKMPQCGFSAQVAQILALLGASYKDVNVLEDMSIREGVKTYSNWPTIPQLYVKGEFVGGCDIIREMYEHGELQQHLQGLGLTTPESTVA
ncbi:MAG: Grx4 family monothiol glutaredoxin [Hyphomicrobiaceae bacterium]